MLISTKGPSRLRSFMFWKKLYDQKPDEFFGYEFPAQSYTEWVAKAGSPCPFCGDYQQDGARNIYCICSTLKWLEMRHNDLQHMETAIRPAQLKDLKPLAGQPGAETLAKLRKSLSAWIADPKLWYFITGGTGCGKTHILKSIKTYFGPLAFYISAESFQGALFQGLREDKGAGVQNLIDLLSTVPILLFDDLGIEHKGDFFTDSLAAVVNRRYNAGPEDFPIVMTSNLSVGGLIQSPDLNIKRIASRMFDEQIGEVWKLDQPDYRLASTKKA